MCSWNMAILLWGVIQIPALVWLYRSEGTWRRYPFGVRLKVLNPFCRMWESDIEADDLDAVRQFRRRFSVYYYLIFLTPLVIFWVSVVLFHGAG